MKEEKSEKESNFSRRKFIVGAGVLAAAASTGTAFGSSEPSCHDDAGSHKKSYLDLMNAASDCNINGKICLDHSFELFKKGNTELAKCASLIEESNVLCSALSTLAAYNSKHLKEVAKICQKFVEECEKECRKHAKNHPICKTLADSCKACISECDKIT